MSKRLREHTNTQAPASGDAVESAASATSTSYNTATASAAPADSVEQAQLEAARIGLALQANYCNLYFLWTQDFISYYDSHNMQEVHARLLSGMDAQSAEFLRHHELLLNLSRAQKHILMHKDLCWTQVDLQLLKRYQDIKASGQIPILSKVNTDFGTCITNAYGLYDAKEIMPNLFEYVDGKAVIDGGGFIGDTITVFRQLFANSVIHSFEPSSDSFEYMCNFVRSEIDKGMVVPQKLALGERAGTLSLSKRYEAQGRKLMDASASLKIDYHKDNSEEVSVVTVDSYVKEHDLQVGLIKLDVEGFEPEIIQGALETIKSQRPVLIIAHYHTAYEFYELKPYLESLGLNYHFELRRSCMALPLTDLVLIAYPR